MPIVQANPEMVGMAGQMLMFAVRAFPVGRELEEIIEQTMDKIGAAAGQPKPPSGEQLKAQSDMAKNKAEIEKAQIDAQSAQVKARSDMQRAQLDSQAAVAGHQMELEKMRMQMQLETHKANLQGQSMVAQHQMDQQRMQGQQQLDSQKQGAQQKTLAQTMATQEQKMVAKDALGAFGEHGGLAPQPREDERKPSPAPWYTQHPAYSDLMSHVGRLRAQDRAA
jgi:hypothetical protein